MTQDILVIKQTSLGDVLHSTGIVRCIKQHYPDSRIILMTSHTCHDIYRHNPWVDEIIIVDRDLIKYQLFRHPVRVIKHIAELTKQIRQYSFTLAFDLQGLFKSVFFLYAAKANKKYVKGSWLGLDGFDNRNMHAIKEMAEVLHVAAIPCDDTHMEIHCTTADNLIATRYLKRYNPDQLPVIIISPYTRVSKKDWPIQHFIQTAAILSKHAICLISGTANRKADIDDAIKTLNHMDISPDRIVNMAGELTLLEFAALLGKAQLLISGDSFPVHLAGAVATPTLALFGPTDESKVGPLGAQDRVIRAKPPHTADEIVEITVTEVVAQAEQLLNTMQT